jgi:hypothetical protein
VRAALAAAVVVATAAVASANPAPPPAGSKKAAYLEAKAAEPRVRWKRPPIGKPPPPVINLRNTWTDEWLALDVDPRRAPSAELRDRFLRDHYTNEPTRIDARLYATLRDAARNFNARRIDIISGFRAPKYNLMLRKKGHEVARDSHGVDLEALHTWAVGKKLGGVGRYRSSRFIHMDTDRVRYWDGD